MAAVRFIPGEFFIVANHFTPTVPHRWLREEVLKHLTGATLAEAQKMTDEIRAANKKPHVTVGMYQAHEIEPSP